MNRSHSARLGSVVLGCCVVIVPSIGRSQTSTESMAAILLKPSESLSAPLPGSKPGPLFTVSDQASGRLDIGFRLQGNAQVRRDGTVVSADQITFSEPPNELTATGNVKIVKDGVSFLGTQLFLQMDTNQGFLSNSTYSLSRLGGRGSAARIDLLGNSKLKASTATFTTCVCDDEKNDKPDWILKTDSLELNQETNQGRTGSTQLFFKDQQIFGAPFFFFPLGKDRQSGFLAPTLESNSRLGIGAIVPYYWNIAPNRDATIATRLMSRRGIAFENEFRFLEPNAAGELRYHFNPNDNAQDGDFRYLANVVTSLRLPSAWNLNLNLRRVSDDNYLVDYGRNILASSETRLPAELSLSKAFGEWNFLARAATWQHLLEARNSPSYEQVPYLSLSTERRGSPWSWSTVIEAARFDIDRPSVAATGWRAVVKPSLSYTYQTPAFFITPKLSFHWSQYELERNPSGPTRLSRSLPTVSLDAGLNFERDMTWRGAAFTQTLEPRVFYVRTPYRDQSTFPVFADTAATELNFAQLLSENSFVGNDRIADLNQISTLLISRIVNKDDGAERFRFAVGQRLYFSQQRVTISPTDPVRTDTRSDLLFAASGELTKGLSLDSGLQYSLQSGSLPRFNASLRYWPSDMKVVNFAYRYSKATNINQFDTSWRWQLDNRWTALGRLNYSFSKTGTVTLGTATESPGLIEAILGAEYNQDCWAFRAVVQRFVTADRKPTTQVFLQLELKGLGQIGVSPFEVLKRSIPGYRVIDSRPINPSNFFSYE